MARFDSMNNRIEEKDQTEQKNLETEQLVQQSASEEPNGQEDINIPENLDSLKLPDDFFAELEAMDRKVSFNIFFSPDNMTAYVRAENYSKEKDADNSVPTSEIYALLSEKKVVYGIDHEGIAEYCKGMIYYKDFIAAQGLRPVNGTDGTVEYFFSTEESYQPKELPDGTVDYKDLGLIKNVEAGDLLCKIIPPTEGTAGTTIFGESVQAKSGSWPQIKAGKNVTLSEDQLQYIAATNGMVQKNRDAIEVKDIYTVSGDVGPATGNIRFNGTVNITGSVLSNFSVFANGDIVVNGFVEGSFLNASGNIVIHKGINGVDGNGMRKGVIKADGNVTVKFAEMAKIVAGGFVYCDYCMNSDVRAGDSIIGKGNRAALFGGNYIAGKVIEANTIGSDMNIPMDVQIIPFWQELKNLEVEPVERIKQTHAALSEMDKGVSKLRKLYEMLEVEMAAASKRRNMDTPNDIELKKEKLKNLIIKYETVKKELQNLKSEKEKLERLNDCQGCMVIAKKVIHTNTRITIGSAMLRLNADMAMQTFTENNRVIESHNMVPGR
ncbi:DUF342 domain-containing protein [Clostridium aminobutyricum]|uniref:DUF342 domain-containing protein n=1 Tax=Clostridium aminobutyricum TaxID=33953 RepID=A0A939D9V1_CLOAM|nr:FapA family protein [Clostridium aminobutyricum]MBN7773722.1 DUF342 domain-containing protein [Clostridium aminobutyricum]